MTRKTSKNAANEVNNYYSQVANTGGYFCPGQFKVVIRRQIIFVSSPSFLNPWSIEEVVV